MVGLAYILRERAVNPLRTVGVCIAAPAGQSWVKRESNSVKNCDRQW